ncbi:hypothetical protein EDB83DRAFT_2555196 [Lactarius deliciosus]|nr:hypothetical protein EDB83DRAFT_2555194 [Lactarius deliciosus]KAH9027465.1 hypothetical protein EDB83DRAFT_2555196 [Lactarius deliciosus]
MAQSEIQDLKRRTNAKENRGRKRPKLNVEARCLSSEEGLRLAQEQQALKDAQEQKKREAQEQRAANEAERERLRRERDPNEPFTGTLATKTKPDLQDIAQALGILTTGGKKDLLKRITQCFDTSPDLRNTPRYEGLFNRRRRPVRDETSNTNPDASGSNPPLSFDSAKPVDAPSAIAPFDSYYPPLSTPLYTLPYSFCRPTGTLSYASHANSLANSIPECIIVIPVQCLVMVEREATDQNVVRSSQVERANVCHQCRSGDPNGIVTMRDESFEKV